MKPPILTIICPAITSRGPSSGKIFAGLQEQIDATKYDVELLVLMDNCKTSIGDKVCKLNHMALGDYVICIGDDDEPEPDFVEQICLAITKNPGVDVVTFDLAYYKGDRFVTNFTYGLGRAEIAVQAPHEFKQNPANFNRYKKLINPDAVPVPGDVPHSRCAIRREIVQAYHYPPGIWYPEDYIFRDYLRDNDILKTEAHIDKVLYTIRYVEKKRYDAAWKRAQQDGLCYNDWRRKIDGQT